MKSRDATLYVSNLDTSEFSRPRWGRRALLALCVFAGLLLTTVQIAAGAWLGAAAIVALCTVDAVLVLGR